MLVFITGATGFIGGAVARELAARGHTLRALVRTRAKAQTLGDLGAEIVQGDLTDAAALAEAGRAAEAVVHMAGITVEPLPGDFTHVNVGGTRGVLEAAAAAGSVRRFLYLSSIAAAGPAPTGTPLTEDMPCRPVSAYGRSMLNGERLVHAFAPRFATTIIRPPFVYGPGDRKLVPLYKLAQWGVAPTVADDGQRVSVIHVDDLARGVADALAHPAAAHATFYLADPDAPTARELARTVGFAAGADVTVVRIPPAAAFGVALVLEGLGRLFHRPSPVNADLLADAMAESWHCSAERARDELGFAVRIGFREGLRQAAAWYLAQGVLV